MGTTVSTSTSESYKHISELPSRYVLVNKNGDTIVGTKNLKCSSLFTYPSHLGPYHVRCRKPLMIKHGKVVCKSGCKSMEYKIVPV